MKTLKRLSQFRPQARNANKGKQAGLTQLDKSLRRDGYSAPMVAAADGEIFAGSKRLERSADVFGVDVEPIVVHSDGKRPVIHVRDDIPTADDPRAVRLGVADNTIAHLDYEPDGELLALLAAEDAAIAEMVKADESSMKAALEFTQSDPQDAEPQIDRAAELREKWQTESGQLWRIGNNRILCSDCLSQNSIDELLDGAEPNFIFSDPPYGVNIVAANVSVGGGEAYNIPFGGVKNKRLGSVGAAKPFGSKAVRGTDGSAHVVDVGKYAPVIGDETTETAVKSSTLYLERFPDAVHVWWGANYYADKLPPSPCWLVWNKETTGNFADCELAWTNQDKAAKLFTHRWNGMLRDSERERRFHPTQKPAALAMWAFTEMGKSGDIVLDPFLGSGPTLLAAQRAERRVFGIELSPEYIAIVLERMATAFPGIEIERL